MVPNSEAKRSTSVRAPEKDEISAPISRVVATIWSISDSEPCSRLPCSPSTVRALLAEASVSRSERATSPLAAAIERAVPGDGGKDVGVAGRKCCGILDGAGDIDEVDTETGRFAGQIGDDLSQSRMRLASLSS